MADDDSLPRIPASEILEKIRKGDPVEHNGVIIEGNLDLSGLDLPTEHVERTDEEKEVGLSESIKIVISPIAITNCKIGGDIEFGNARFEKEIMFYGSQFCGGANFSETKFISFANFMEAKFSGDANFETAKFSDYAGFWDTQFSSDANFVGGKFSDNSYFGRSKFSGDANFTEAKFSNIANFTEAKFSGLADFWDAQFSGDANFSDSQFSNIANFRGANFDGKYLFFKDAKFIHPEDQEYPCRRAKQILQDLGDKEEADYHFYREMEGRRIRLKNEPLKPLLITYPFNLKIEPDTRVKKAVFKGYKYLRYKIFEGFFIQFVFGYGVHPFRLAGFWLLAVFLFAVAYWQGHGIHRAVDSSMVASINETIVTSFRESLYFSIVTAATPGYGGYRPQGIYQTIACVQAIFGTFMWAAFITTFARKFMR